MTAQSEEYLAVLKASYNYDPQSDDEIAIKEDQILLLKERVDDEFVYSLLSSFFAHRTSSWWKVKIKGDAQEEDTPEGLVPAAYVEPVRHVFSMSNPVMLTSSPIGCPHFYCQGHV
jgi:actin cytoskeleton-regulatory complex protein SLA1